MTILQRVIGGFAVLVVLLLAMAGISYQSTHSISDRISIITGQSAPLSRAASELYVHVLRANQALLGILVSNDSKQIDDGKQPFNDSMARFNQLLDSTPAYIGDRAELRDNLNQQRQLSAAYAEQAQTLIAGHRQHVLQSLQSRVLQGYSSSQGAQLTGYLRDYIARERSAGAADNVAAGEKLLLEVGKSYEGLAAHAATPDIQTLQRVLNLQDEVISTRARELTAVDPRGGRIAGVMVNPACSTTSPAVTAFIRPTGRRRRSPSRLVNSARRRKPGFRQHWTRSASSVISHWRWPTRPRRVRIRPSPPASACC
ncbi:Methyl-accepting chemotaxis protein [Pseudomonas amygdali pv. mori]|uniref:Methyl-accepting chemotaxis protein n=1 Tax=Pseudomonas amygdali pv. mori TaxID=34065 RepID=A0A0P9VGE9_PSEA0|nr:Methyl-accepting chemotaxis protein [Pseudomonas amygdali pv. mori]